MSTYQHHLTFAFIPLEQADPILEWIINLPRPMPALFQVIPSLINNSITVIMGPDGGKLGGGMEIEAKEVRQRFFLELHKRNHTVYIIEFGELKTQLMEVEPNGIPHT